MKIIIDIKCEDIDKDIHIVTETNKCTFCKKFKDPIDMGINSKGKLFKVCKACREKQKNIRELKKKQKDEINKLNLQFTE